MALDTQGAGARTLWASDWEPVMVPNKGNAWLIKNYGSLHSSKLPLGAQASWCLVT